MVRLLGDCQRTTRYRHFVACKNLFWSGSHEAVKAFLISDYGSVFSSFRSLNVLNMHQINLRYLDFLCKTIVLFSLVMPMKPRIA